MVAITKHTQIMPSFHYIRQALGNKHGQSLPRPYLFGLNGFDADRQWFSLFLPVSACFCLFLPVLRLIRASMVCCLAQLGTPLPQSRPA
jgi:hypothetical protein